MRRFLAGGAVEDAVVRAKLCRDWTTGPPRQAVLHLPGQQAAAAVAGVKLLADHLLLATGRELQLWGLQAATPDSEPGSPAPAPAPPSAVQDGLKLLPRLPSESLSAKISEEFPASEAGAGPERVFRADTENAERCEVRQDFR